MTCNLSVAAAVAAVVAASAGMRAAAVGEPLRFVFHHENVLGTSLELRVRSLAQPDAARAETAALSEIDRLARIFSSYSTASEFSRWQSTRGTPVAVSTELFEVLSQCDRWRIASQGAFNPAAETFSRLWKSAASTDHTPAAADLAEGVLRASVPAWSLDRKSGLRNTVPTVR
jgi:thiamine biosynthesis lipoprotein ApbE